jgi:hypothetical protein
MSPAKTGDIFFQEYQSDFRPAFFVFNAKLPGTRARLMISLSLFPIPETDEKNRLLAKPASPGNGHCFRNTVV